MNAELHVIHGDIQREYMYTRTKATKSLVVVGYVVVLQCYDVIVRINISGNIAALDPTGRSLCTR